MIRSIELQNFYLLLIHQVGIKSRACNYLWLKRLDGFE